MPRSSTNKNTKSNMGKQSRFSQWITEWITDWWGLELICWTISALSILAIVILLEKYKNQPLPQWYFNLTINSLISIFAQIGQITMMNPVVECISQLKWLWFVRKQKLIDIQAFDDASRGPTGSLILIGKLRGLHLVLLGAAIAVCSTAFGAFAQQVVTYPLRSHPFGNATTPFVFNITGEMSNAFEAEIQEGFENGVAANTSVPIVVNPTCTTGNCSWTEYPSLGICANVVDVSSSILENACDIAVLDKFFRQVGLKNPGYPCFNYTLPFNAQDQTNGFGANNFESISLGNATLTNAVPLSPPSSMQFLTISSGASNSSLIDGYIIYQPDVLNSINSTLANPLAYHFNFNVCIQMYNTTVINGLASTTLISSQPFDANMEEVVGADRSISMVGNSTAINSVGGVDFAVTMDAFQDFTIMFATYFSDNCYLSINQTRTAEILSLTDGILCMDADLFGTVLAQEVLTSDPLSVAKQLTQQIANSMTNILLSGAGGNTRTAPFLGTAFSPQPFVGTNYLWLIFPISLITLTLIFLLATILKSQRLGSKVWKSSAIAMLQGLDTGLHTSFGGLALPSEIDQKAELVKVKFHQKQGKGGRLVEAKRYALPKQK